MKKLIAIFLFYAFAASAQTPEEGKTIFQDNCAICHTVGEGRLIGPDLAGVTESRDKEWIFHFITNSAKLIESGDETAVALFNEFNNIAMPPHDFSESDLENLYAYMGDASSETQAQQPLADTSPESESAAEKVTLDAQIDMPGWIFGIFSAVGVVILALLGVIFKLLRIIQRL